MKAHAVSVGAIAKLCGVSEAAVYGWFKTGRIAKRHLPILSRRLGLTTDQLIGHDSPAGVHVDPQPTVEVEPVELPRDAIELARAWMVLPENERNEFRRKIETAALRYRDNVPDSRMKDWGKSKSAGGPPKPGKAGTQ